MAPRVNGEALPNRSDHTSAEGAQEALSAAVAHGPEMREFPRGNRFQPPRARLDRFERLAVPVAPVSATEGLAPCLHEHPRPERSEKMIRLLARCALGLALLAAPAGCKRQGENTGGLPRNETLYVGGRQWGEPSTFNPLEGQAAWPLVGYDGSNLLYETLLVFNPLDGKLEPLLAESYQVFDDRIEVQVQASARWSDGKPVTARDVKYTYELAKEHKSLPHATVWSYLKEIKLPEVEAGPTDHPRKLVFVLDPDERNPLVLLDQFQQNRIVPEHVIAPLLAQAKGDMSAFLRNKFDKNPVVSGPYTLHSYSSEKIVTVRRDDYWGNQVFFAGKKAVPKYVVHPIYKSNDHFSVALQQGRLDMSTSFIPRIWRKQPKGVQTWYDKEPFFVSNCITMLFVNVLKKPIDDPHMRRAMAFSINYADIRELAVSGYSEPLRPGLILPTGLEKQFFSEEETKQYGASVFDPERAKAELKAGGYTAVWNDKGELVETRDASGKRVPTVRITSPSGWTDWESIVRVTVRSMRAVGIDVRENFIDGNLFWGAVFGGEFDLIMYNPSPQPSPSKPWSRFEFILTSKDWQPVGQKMFKNFGRFNNPNFPGYIARFDELIDLIPKLKDPVEIQKAYTELNRLYMQQQPVLPLVYRADSLYEFSTRMWQGFPTAKNPFLPPQMPADRLGTHILWHLKPSAAVN
jgi:peptide/nickel transport system substrate-binding protein